MSRRILSAMLLVMLSAPMSAQGASPDASTGPMADDLTTLVPTTVGDFDIYAFPARFDDFLGSDEEREAFRSLLSTLGKAPADVSLAYGYGRPSERADSPVGESGMSISLMTVDGVEGSDLVDLFLDLVEATNDGDHQPVTEWLELDGRHVAYSLLGTDDPLGSYLYSNEDILYAFTMGGVDPPTPEEVLAALPVASEEGSASPTPMPRQPPDEPARTRTLFTNRPLRDLGPLLRTDQPPMDLDEAIKELNRIGRAFRKHLDSRPLVRYVVDETPLVLIAFEYIAPGLSDALPDLGGSVFGLCRRELRKDPARTRSGKPVFAGKVSPKKAYRNSFCVRAFADLYKAYAFIGDDEVYGMMDRFAQATIPTFEGEARQAYVDALGAVPRLVWRSTAESDDPYD